MKMTFTATKSNTSSQKVIYIIKYFLPHFNLKLSKHVCLENLGGGGVGTKTKQKKIIKKVGTSMVLRL
jgi:hypothetical protein